MNIMKDNSTIDDTTANTTTDANVILTAIIYNKQFGKKFVPEVDGKKIMMEMLPYERGKKQLEKAAKLYKMVLSACPYSHRIYLTNDGKRDYALVFLCIKVQEIIVDQALTHTVKKNEDHTRGHMGPLEIG